MHRVNHHHKSHLEIPWPRGKLLKQEDEEKRKKVEAKAKIKAKAEKEKETSSSSNTDLETPSSEENEPVQKYYRRRKDGKNLHRRRW